MPYCTPADVRAVYPALDDTGIYPDALLSTLIDEFEQIAEQYRGTAYLPRTVTETLVVPPGTYWTNLVLKHAPVTAITNFTLDGNAVTGYTLDQTLGRVNNTYLFGQWTNGFGTISITYTHGLTSPPTPILRACKMYVRNAAKADQSGTSRDVLSQSVDGATTRYATPDWKAGRPTGWLDVDRILNSVPDNRVPAVA